MTQCRCGENDCEYLAAGYPFCRACQEHHRGGECPIDDLGRSLKPCGHPWDLDGAPNVLCCEALAAGQYVDAIRAAVRAMLDAAFVTMPTTVELRLMQEVSFGLALNSPNSFVIVTTP